MNKEKLKKELQFDTFEIEEVGNHYWDGDYSPDISELHQLTQLFNKLVAEKIDKL